MKTITFASLKGGVGKTASALSTAGILAQEKRVLIIDLDPQMAATSHLAPESDRTIRQVLNKSLEITNAILRVTDNLYFIPAQLELMLLETELLTKPNREYILHDKLQELEDNFDYCILDTPPAVGLLTRSALIASNAVVIPAQMESWASKAISVTREVIEDCREASKYFKKSIDEFVLPTFWEDNRQIKNMVLDLISKKYPAQVTGTKIHRSEDIARTYSQRGEFLPEKSRAYIEYSEFCGYLR
jgi:chromosome partitioning protein